MAYLELTRKAEFEELYFKGKYIQSSLKIIQKSPSIEEISKKVKEYMTAKGNINSALNVLISDMENGVLPLNKDTISKLFEKHPKSKTASQDILLNSSLQNIYPSKFQSIDKEMIRKAAIRPKGGSGPSGMDADNWYRILASINFGTSVVTSVRHLLMYSKTCVLILLKLMQ